MTIRRTELLKKEITDKLYNSENRFNEMFALGHPVLGHYDRHVLAMTRENLDSKSDIATELGWRDWKIEQLNERIKEFEQIQEKNETKQYFCYYDNNEIIEQNTLIVIVRGENAEEVLSHLLEKFRFTFKRYWRIKEIVKNETDTIDFFAWSK